MIDLLGYDEKWEVAVIVFLIWAVIWFALGATVWVNWDTISGRND